MTGYPVGVGSVELPAIGDYGFIGDTRTGGLVSSGGSLDWLCFPRFDSPPVFGRLVAGDAGGSFALSVQDVRTTRRRYRDGSTLIETTWKTPTGEATLLDGMVADTGGALLPKALLVRELRCDRGTVVARVRFDPRRGWRGDEPNAVRRHGRLLCRWGPTVISLATLPDLGIAPGVEQDVGLRAGERLLFAVGLDDHGPAILPDPEGARRHLERTDRWWRSWSSDLDLPSIGEAAVLRSLITLRLLTYAPSGAPAAAPTTSLPEIPGGTHNWDYRHAWIRDASMGVSSFLAGGSVAEARAFQWWMLHASRRTRPELRVVYDLFGGTNLAERELPDLPGYRGARPVRVGNAAVEQFQLDAYGWILDAGWAYLAATGDLYRETWRALRGHADLLAVRWTEPDHGIWELRGERRQYVHSKAMAWLGLDRAIAIARRLGASRRRVERWTSARTRLAEEITSRGFDDRSGAYTQAFGSTELDASALSFAYLGLEPSDSPRIRRTIDAVRQNLGAGGPLVYRFRPGEEGAFLPCSFWLSRALAATGSLDDARALLEEACSLATPLGLFAEEMDPSSGEHLGNFPLAFTHAALVLAADELDRAERRLKDGGTDRGSPRTRREPRSPRSASLDRS